MGLSERQVALYCYRIDVWRQGDAPAGADSSTYSKVYDELPALFVSTPENDDPTAVGRNKAVNIFTMDKWHLPIICDGFTSPIDIRDTDYITMTKGPNPADPELAPTTDHPDVGKWWAVQGGPMTKGRRSNVLEVYGKQSQDPNEDGT